LSGASAQACASTAGRAADRLRIPLCDHFSAHQAVRISKPTNDERELLAAAKDLFDKLFTRRVAVRLVGVSVRISKPTAAKRTVRYQCEPAVVFEPGLDSVRGRTAGRVFSATASSWREHYATKPNGLVPRRRVCRGNLLRFFFSRSLPGSLKQACLAKKRGVPSLSGRALVSHI